MRNYRYKTLRNSHKYGKTKKEKAVKQLKLPIEDPVYTQNLISYFFASELTELYSSTMT